jgi:signal transduction histidine kinase
LAKEQREGFAVTAEARSHNTGEVHPVVSIGGRIVDGQRDDFLAVLSHELRNPLQSLMGWLQILERDAPSEIRERAIASIGRNARAMRQIVDDISDQSRIRCGKLRLTLEPVDVRTIARNVVEGMRPTAEERRVCIELRTADPLPAIHADAGRLRQVLANLLSNALKFTPADGRILVEAAGAADGVQISVSDTGCGIERAFLPHVFGRFYQGQNASAHTQGLGLGLALVKELVEQHGGTVGAQSDGPGRGARFTVMLPMSAAGSRWHGEPHA